MMVIPSVSVIPSAARDLPSRQRGRSLYRDARSLVVSLLGMTIAASLGAQQQFTRADTAKLHRTLDGIAAAHHGVLGYTVNNLDTGERLSLRGDETFPTASLIKVPILVTLYDLADKKQLSLDDPLTVLKIDQVPGSGVLQFMKSGMTLTMNDAAHLMIILSDNTATNILLDRVAVRRVWTKMESLGLVHTKVHSKTFQRFTSVAMDSSVKYGLGVTTPNEMAKLFELLAQGKAVNPVADSTMLEMLANNADGEQMQRYVDGLSVPHKTARRPSRTECALFRLQSASSLRPASRTPTLWPSKRIALSNRRAIVPRREAPAIGVGPGHLNPFRLASNVLRLGRAQFMPSPTEEGTQQSHFKWSYCCVGPRVRDACPRPSFTQEQGRGFRENRVVMRQSKDDSLSTRLPT